MAQNAFHVNNSSNVTTTSNNFASKNNFAAGPKRAALSVINGNLQKEANCFLKKDAFGFNQTGSRYEAEALKFSIFQDDLPKPEPVVSKTPALPKHVTQLITYDNRKAPSILKSSGKENKFSWSVDRPTRLSDREKEYIDWSSPHLPDIYFYMRDLEKRHCPRPNYMSKQQDITLSMRSVLVDWLVEVGEEYKLHPETIHLAVSYTDRFLSQMAVLRGKLQLVGTACMFISSKYEEIYPPELREFVYITDDTYTKKQVLRMEHLVLKVLDFNVASPTAYSFLQLYCCMAKTPERTSYLAQYICELSLLEADPFLNFPTSEIAAAALALANYTVGENPWGDEMAEMTGYSIESISGALHCLHKRHSTISCYPQQSIREKYMSPKLQCVAGIPCLNILIL